MKQFLLPDRRLFHAGDWITVRLEMENRPGRAFFRTNIGRAAVRRAEVIALTEADAPAAGRDWRDIPMRECADGGFELALPLAEVGVFHGKCCFSPADGKHMEWPAGDNFRFKVESAVSVAGNLLYCAFVRQFKPEASSRPETELEALDRAGYTVIPPSGTFRALIRELDFIFGELGCRILQLLPVHPTPCAYGRMGRYGSPFAALDYFEVDPALADFDVHATPREQFTELVRAVHARGGRLFLDIPVNHTGWASRLQSEHPEYFVRRTDGTFESPGAWGVVWADLCQLNYAADGVFEQMAEVFLHWCRHGVDGFRCDAGYMIPADAWRYILARVRAEYPDTVFLLEGLGGPGVVQNELLGSVGLDWAYSELFQNYSRDQIASYFPVAAESGKNHGLLVHFAETHDNSRLAAVSETYARMRCALTALLSENGAFGFTNGVEFYAKEKIDVHGAPSLNWKSPNNQVVLLRKLCTLLAHHGAFQAGAEIRLVQSGGGNVIAALRHADGADLVLVLVNLDTDHPSRVAWNTHEFKYRSVFDLLSEERLTLACDGPETSLELPPGGFLALSPTPWIAEFSREPERSRLQRAAAMAARVWRFFHFPGDHSAAEAASFAPELLRDAAAFLRRLAGSEFPPVARYRLDWDELREVPVPPDSILWLESTTPFRVELVENEKTIALGAGIRTDAGGYLYLLPLGGAAEGCVEVRFEIYKEGEIRRGTGHLRRLAQTCPALAARVERAHLTEFHYAFAANDRGGMTQTRARWGELFSKYDALLAANIETRFPVDRRVMFTRCRGWLVVNDYSYELDSKYLESFTGSPDNRAVWHFVVPAGRGQRVPLLIELAGALDCDVLKLTFRRPLAGDALVGALPEDQEIRLILRPDLEDRPNHEVTKAYAGAEARFSGAVSTRADGFRFQPGAAALDMGLSHGRFVSQPEWQYMVQLPLEERYGQEHTTDLFSPGYFEFELLGGEAGELSASVGEGVHAKFPDTALPLPDFQSSLDALRSGLRCFNVKRNENRTVIAGYPWFLDWGRDTFIALRGFLAAGELATARAILREFASYEDRGTIPNVIRGGDTGNRDTSDAPLWLIRVVREYIESAGGDRSILEDDCGGRTLLQVLSSIRDCYKSGTPNGIRMHPEHKLIYSPAHFTWMDTNHPAGTPREGYPIEIQALWHSALEFLGDDALAAEVKTNIVAKFYLPELGYLSDCLHGEAAVPDDHLRPNQLFALTLGALTDPDIQRAVLKNTALLLTPGAIRTLDTLPVRYQLPVRRDGVLLNDPIRPYRGRYEGPEDTSRKVAYHNGTGWCWPFPSYAEAYFRCAGEAGRTWALSLLWSVARYLDEGAFGQLPEVADGDWPHRPGGCGAQAWSLSEFYRVLKLLS